MIEVKMKYILIISFVWISFQASGQKISRSDLLGCWTDSREENTPGSNVWINRPCDYKVFPPLRFRFLMDLKGDSTCSWLHFSEYDGHYMVNGKWSFNEETKELRLFDLQGKESLKFTIQESGEEILKIKNRGQ